MIWFLKIGVCLVLISLVLEVLFCMARPITYTDKTRKIDNVWTTIFGSTLCAGIISCLIWFCSLILLA